MLFFVWVLSEPTGTLPVATGQLCTRTMDNVLLYTFSICLCYIWLISIPLYMLMYKVGPLYMFIYKVECPDRSDTPQPPLCSVVGWPFGLEHTTLLSPLGRGVPPGWDGGLIHPTVLLPRLTLWV